MIFKIIYFTIIKINILNKSIKILKKNKFILKFLNLLIIIIMQIVA